MRLTYSRGDTHSYCEEVSSCSASAMWSTRGFGQAAPGCRNHPDRPPISGALQRHNLVFAARDQRLHVVAPARQCSRNRALVIRPVVGTGNAPAVTGIVVQDCLDVVRLDPDIGHAGSDGPSEIVQAPRFHDAGEASIEIELAAAPGRKTVTGGIAEQMVAARSRRRGCKIKKPPKP